MTPANRPDLDAIDARVKAATPGPWDPEVDGWNDVLYVTSIRTGASWEYGAEATLEDFLFIRNARTDVPALVAYTRALEAKVAELERVITKAAQELLDERPGCSECVGEYGKSGTAVGYDLEEALKCP